MGERTDGPGSSLYPPEPIGRGLYPFFFFFFFKIKTAKYKFNSENLAKNETGIYEIFTESQTCEI